MHLKLTMFVILAAIHTSAGPISAAAPSAQNDQTKVWDFICERYALGGIAKIQIAKSDKGGVLNLEIESTGNGFHIGGPVYVYLFNNKVITCTDKGRTKSTATGIAATYLFSDNEMAQLKKTDIQSLRFTIRGDQTKFTSQVGTFTAVNKKSYFSGFDKEEKNHYLTSSEIAALK